MTSIFPNKFYRKRLLCHKVNEIDDNGVMLMVYKYWLSKGQIWRYAIIDKYAYIAEYNNELIFIERPKHWRKPIINFKHK